jgi:predicted alpha/beta-hydrolase family hydrolase
MLFLSGTRDDLAESTLLEPLVESLPNAELHWLETADHGYRVLKRSRTRTDSVFDEMAEAARAFIDAHPARKAR